MMGNVWKLAVVHVRPAGTSIVRPEDMVTPKFATVTKRRSASSGLALIRVIVKPGIVVLLRFWLQLPPPSSLLKMFPFSVAT